MTEKPNDILVSVILPVYNSETTIKNAVDSILKQTFQNFELLIINDGSNDQTLEIITSINDERIRILNQEHKGLVPALNTGIHESRGKYIARMDADDLALPERFQKQVTFMEQSPSVAVLGTATLVAYADGTKRVRLRPLNTTSIRKSIVKICLVCHSSVMIRKEMLEKVGLYDVVKDGSKGFLVEDYDLWTRMLAAGYDLANLPDVLMIIYKKPTSIMGRFSLKKRIRQQIISRINIIKTLNLGYAAYFNIIPVIILSILSYYNIKIDNIFNYLSRTTQRD
jgi:glycosyltransferase involved in cell wall biosynthesis